MVERCGCDAVLKVGDVWVICLSRKLMASIGCKREERGQEWVLGGCAFDELRRWQPPVSSLEGFLMKVGPRRP